MLLQLFLKVDHIPNRAIRRSGPTRALVLLAFLLCVVGGGSGASGIGTEPAEVVGPSDAVNAVVVDLVGLRGPGVGAQSWEYAPAGMPDELPPTSGWRTVATHLHKLSAPTDWSGLGWFRLRLDAGPAVAGATLGLLFQEHRGASKVFLGARQLVTIGSMSRLSALAPVVIDARNRSDPVFFSLKEQGPQTLYVLFANPQFSMYHRVGLKAGFTARLHTAERASFLARERQRSLAGLRGLFSAIFLSFALLHLLLFLFRRESLENLYFALFCSCLAILAFLLVHKGLAPDPRLVSWTESLMNVAGLGFGVVGVLFVYRAFGRRVPRWFRWSSIAVSCFVPVTIVWPASTVLVVFMVMLGGLLEMARFVLGAVRRGEEGAAIVGVGIVAINLGFGAAILFNLGFLPGGFGLGFQVPFGSVLVLIVSMSVFLARRFARTHQKLEHQLERVRILSEERLQQERRERQQEIRTKLLEADNARKAEELEEARLLQLSMLPQKLPQHPEIEVAAHMTTATEVGGDYYDFDVASDGTMTIAVGDATGHGMRAGTMVTATKSLFNALGGDQDIVETVKRSNLALKRMNLRSLNMAFLLARYRDGRLTVTSAGMPEPLIYRASEKSVEALEIGGMPLGSVRSFPYRSVEVLLSPGDKVLFMSDGFPERLNPSGEQLGYPRAERFFAEVGAESADTVLESLVAAGESWAQGLPADDDLTFVVLAVRSS